MWIVDTENFALETGPGYALFAATDKDGGTAIYLGLPPTSGGSEGSRTQIAVCASMDEAQIILTGIWGAITQGKPIAFVGALQAQARKMCEARAEREKPAIAVIDGTPVAMGPDGTVDKRAGQGMSRRERRQRGEMPS